jgi:hypothetical protein
MYGIDAGMGGKKKKLAGMKAKNKMSKTGKMLDDMEMKQAPRRPFLEKVKPTKMILTKAMRKKSGLKFKPGGDK